MPENKTQMVIHLLFWLFWWYTSVNQFTFTFTFASTQSSSSEFPSVEYHSSKIYKKDGCTIYDNDIMSTFWHTGRRTGRQIDGARKMAELT